MSNQTATSVRKALLQLKNSEQAINLQRFFKTGQGEYGESDIFLGIKVPIQRQVAKNFQNLPLAESLKLLHSQVHEHRLTALIIIGTQYELARRKHDLQQQRTIAQVLLKSIRWINNWDLVDTISPQVFGPFLLPDRRKIHRQLAASKNFWERRIAMVSTLPAIRSGQFQDALYTANLLVQDQNDLIQKAVGWMLREIGKQDVGVLRQFLNQHASHMPRIMLRYAIERFGEAEKKIYMQAQKRIRNST